MEKQGEFPSKPRGTVKIESPNGVGRVSGGKVTISSYEPGRTTERLPYRDTVSGRYRERE